MPTTAGGHGPRIELRPVTRDDIPLLRHWDRQPHVIAADPNDDWAWESEAGREADWREQMIAELDGRPLGFMELLDPARDPTHYWGEIDPNLRALDIWIGEPDDLGHGYGTAMMHAGLRRLFADPSVHGVVLDPLIGNARVHPFYERLGFEFVEDRRFGPDACRIYRLDRARFAPRGPVRLGIDGCPKGWFYVRDDGGALSCGVTPSLAYLLTGLPAGSRAFIDIPIGLRERRGDARGCDTAARKLLGRGRASSVFPAPLRGVLDAPDHASANARSRRLCGKGLSRQAYLIAPKIKEVDDLLARQRSLRDVVREVHPELCFWALAGGRAMVERKKTVAGFAERMAVLRETVPGADVLAQVALARYRRKDVARDDIADALVALATACAPAGALRTVPGSPERDRRGLPMEMVYRTAGAKSGTLRA